MGSKVWANLGVLIIGSLFLVGCNNGPEKNKGVYGATSGNPPYGSAQASQKSFPKANDNPSTGPAKVSALPPYTPPGATPTPGALVPNNGAPAGLQPNNNPTAPFPLGGIPPANNPNTFNPGAVPANPASRNPMPYPSSDFGTIPSNPLPPPAPVTPPPLPFKN